MGIMDIETLGLLDTAIVEAIRVIFGLYVVFILREAIIAGILSLIIPIVILVYLFADHNVRAECSASST